VSLGNGSVTAVANTLFTPGTALSSYKASFSEGDFHVVRGGLNLHF
jgi:hypothetical protein